MKKILLIVLAAFCLSACQTKDSYVDDFKDFVKEVKAGMDDYTERDWEKVDEKFERLSTEQYKKFEEELSTDEKAEIVKLQATYAGLKMKAGMKDASQKVNKLLEGLKEGTKWQNCILTQFLLLI